MSRERCTVAHSSERYVASNFALKLDVVLCSILFVITEVFEIVKDCVKFKLQNTNYCLK